MEVRILYLWEESPWRWSSSIVGDKVVQSVLVCVAVAEGEQARESFEEPGV